MSTRPQELFGLFAALDSLPGIGPKTAKSFDGLAIERPRDALFTLPYSVIDRRPVETVQGVPAGTTVTVEVTIGAHSPARKRGAPDRVLCHDAQTDITLVFFHARGDWLAKQMPNGARRIISGKLELYDGMAQIVHPDYILPPEDAGEMPRFEPVYPLTAGVTQKLMAKAAEGALARAPELPEWIDAELKRREGWPDWHAAITKAHHPEGLSDLAATAPARARLAYDELFAHQMTLALARRQARRKKGRVTRGTGALSSQVLESLPYKPTGAQTRAIAEIAADMGSDRRMNRLLQGDVGAGKTLVAFMALLTAVEAGGQGVM
ncbi:MAG: ATP-dependent DNA helicase RecG, partial [Thioclava sp.]|nr:ATP-dependent DNA helicase RecG [Thioclava sp.]